MKSNAVTVEEYLQSLPADRRTAISALHKVILANLPSGYETRICYGMIGYVVPHSIYPAGYHCDPKLPLVFACLGSQKNHMSLHLMTVYGDPAMEKWFRQAWTATGKKLDMGKACVRIKRSRTYRSKSWASSLPKCRWRNTSRAWKPCSRLPSPATKRNRRRRQNREASSFRIETKTTNLNQP